MKITSLLCYLLLTSSSFGFTRVTVDEWLEFSENQKFTFIAGIVDGMEIGMNFSYRETNPVFLEEIQKNYNENAKTVSGVSKKQIVAGLNNLYTDYRNRKTPVAWGLIAITKDVKGQTKIEFKKHIENLRKVDWD